MKLTKNQHWLEFKAEDKELDAPDRAYWRFKTKMKVEIPADKRLYDEDTKTWSIDNEYVEILSNLMKDYFGG